MKKAKILFWAAVMLSVVLMAGCDNKADVSGESQPVQTEAGAGGEDQTESRNTAGDADLKETENQDKDSESKASDGEDAKNQVAGEGETAARTEVVEEGMTPVYADSLKEGVYPVTVDSSSSMFKISECQLIVGDGKMSAVMTMHGTGYLYLFMGTGSEAAAAGGSDYIPFDENNAGEHTFKVPVEALDMGIDCAAFSKKKEKWYDRQLVFRADSLPQEAFTEGVLTSVEDLGLADGEYTAEVRLEGGSGKAAVESPAKLRIEDGKAYATIIWSSSNYDYMKVDDVKYDRLETEENSAFEIPVSGFDWNLPVIADTTAMSTPHEIEYTLYFDSQSVKKAN